MWEVLADKAGYDLELRDFKAVGLFLS